MALGRIYNARFYSIDQIAKQFIINDNYLSLLSENHSLLMGPRGCGKTTLLKMLTPRAIEVYGSANINIKFYGVYIPADTQWLRQNELLNKLLGSDEMVRPIVKCFVNFNILISCLSTIKEIIDINLPADTRLAYEIDISRKIISSFFESSDITPTFQDIRLHIETLVVELNRQINKVHYKLIESNKIKVPILGFDDYIYLVRSVNTIFRLALNNYPLIVSKKWALCFDELELAPQWILHDLISSYFRSTDQNYFIKLTTTPIMFNENEVYPNSPQEGHDFNIVRCWVHNRKTKSDWIKFSKKIFKSAYSSYGLDFILQRHDYALGIFESEPYRFEGINFTVPEFYPKSIMYTVVKALATRDESFRDFLISNNVDIYNPTPNDNIDELWRKIKPIIAFRYYFKRQSRARSRKNILLYFGGEYASELADGNPRLLLSLFEMMKKHLKLQMTIPINVQSNVIMEFSEKVFEGLRFHPDNYIHSGAVRIKSLADLLNILGRAFFNSLVNEKFIMDPINCFTVDKKVPPHIVEIVTAGLKVGAFQHLEPSDNPMEETIYDTKLRMNFALYPYFRLPKREYGSIRLSTILLEEETLPLLDLI